MSLPQTPSSSNDNQSIPNFSIEFLCKLIPKEFSGNRYELGQFLANCNNAIALASPNQHTPLLYFILSKISGRAKEQLAQQQFDNWDELKEKLKILYQDKKHYCQLMEELNNCRQNYSESVSDFFQRLEVLNSRAISAVQQYTSDHRDIPGKIQAINEITLNRFVYHSHPSISQMLRWKDFDSLNSAYTAAIAEERALNIQKPKTKFCKICNRKNHDTSQCRYKKPVERNINQVTSELKVCRYCKNTGHLIEECRKRIFNNSRRENNFATSNKTPQPVNLNSKNSLVTNTALEEQISQLTVFEH